MPPTRNEHSGFRHYAHSGVSIASELELPEWSQCGQVSNIGMPDVVIHLDPSGQASAKDLEQKPLITVREYGLHVPDVGHFHVRDGREIHVAPLPAADPAKVRAWLFGPAWGALCYQRGFFLIHASAVRIGSEAVIFCGQAGRGKSTLAAQLAARGYALVGDDVCRLDLPSLGSAVVYPAPPRMKLWSDALGDLGWSTRQLAPDHLRDGKFHLSLPGASLAEPLTVRAVYLLAWGELGIREVHGTAAFHGFLSAAAYRTEMLEQMDLMGAYCLLCMDFLRLVPLAELTRPRDFTVTARTLDLLAAEWSAAAV
jgi:hypothetical protein